MPHVIAGKLARQLSHDSGSVASITEPLNLDRLVSVSNVVALTFLWA